MARRVGEDGNIPPPGRIAAEVNAAPGLTRQTFPPASAVMFLRREVSLVVAWIGFFLTASLGGAELPKLPLLKPLRLDLASPTAVIVAPPAPAYQAIAEHLRDELARLARRAPRLVPDSTPPQNLGAGPILVLGNLMDCQLARKLYFEAYDFTDYAWPGVGGHVVRTIRDPLGTGAHVIMLGGSDTAGVADAAAALLVLVKERGSVLGYLNQVKLGRWADLIERSGAKLLTNSSDKVWMRSGSGSGYWDHQIQIAKAATGYLRTGNEAYLTPFRRELRYWFDHTVYGIYHHSGDVKSQVHGFINTILIPWDLVADHPAFSPSERQEIDANFLWVLSSTEGPGRIEHESRKRQVRGNHGTRAGLDAFFGGRYFFRHYALQEGRHWLEIADRYFAPQMDCYKPWEDSWGHQWAASMHDVLTYYLAAGKYEYLQSDGFKRAADRALIAHPTKSAPLTYMSACAAASGDTGYLSGWADDDRRYQSAARLGGMGRRVSPRFLHGQARGSPYRSAGRCRGSAGSALVRDEQPHHRERKIPLRQHPATRGMFRQDLVPRRLGRQRLLFAAGWHRRRRTCFSGCQLHRPLCRTWGAVDRRQLPLDQLGHRPRTKRRLHGPRCGRTRASAPLCANFTPAVPAIIWRWRPHCREWVTWIGNATSFANVTVGPS